MGATYGQENLWQISRQESDREADGCPPGAFRCASRGHGARGLPMGQGVVVPPPAHERRHRRGVRPAKYRHAHVRHEGRRIQGSALRHVQDGDGQRLPYHQGVARLPHRALEAHARQQDGSDCPSQAAQDQRGMGYRSRESRVQGRAALRGHVHGVQCRADGEHGEPRSR